MTKKDYIAIAKIIDESTDSFGRIIKANLVDKLSRYFRTTNPRFDEVKFRLACYPAGPNH